LVTILPACLKMESTLPHIPGQTREDTEGILPSAGARGGGGRIALSVEGEVDDIVEEFEACAPDPAAGVYN